MSELLTFLAIAVITIGAAVFVLSPLVTGATDEDERERYETAETKDSHDYRAATEREIRLDHATGKITDADMERLLAELSEVGDRDDAGDSGPVDAETSSAPSAETPTLSAASVDVEQLIASARKPCPKCGKRNRASATRCAACGSDLATTPEGNVS